MAFSVRLEKSGAYSFSLDALADLCKTVEDFTKEKPKVSVSLEGRDSQTSTGKDLNEAIDDPYVRNSFIESVEVEGLSSQLPVRMARLNVRSSKWSRSPVEVFLSGEREACNAARSEIEKIIEGCKQWYSPIYAARGLGIAALWFLALAGAVFFVWALHRLLVPNMNLEGLGAVLWITIAAILFVGSWLKHRMYPQIVFGHGRSASVGERAKTWRTAFWSGVVLATIVALVREAYLGRLSLGS